MVGIGNNLSNDYCYMVSATVPPFETGGTINGSDVLLSVKCELSGFSLSAQLNTNRLQHTATLLNNGLVLIAGGSQPDANGVEFASAELYDPATGTIGFTGSMNVARKEHTATLLNDGKVLMIGGRNTAQGILADAEINDPATGVFTLVGALNDSRVWHTATLLPDSGEVIIFGGVGESWILNIEKYDPLSQTFSITGVLPDYRSRHTATLINDGTILIAGGEGAGVGVFSSAELYDPSTGIFTSVGPMADPRSSHRATLMYNGSVVITGGSSTAAAGYFLNTVEVYDPINRVFSQGISFTQGRFGHSATLLKNGYMLLAGGSGSHGTFSAAEQYDVNTGAQQINPMYYRDFFIPELCYRTGWSS